MEPSCEQLAEIVKLYYECKYVTLVIRTMRKRHPEVKMLNRMLIYRLVRKFEGKGTISDTRHNSCIGRPRSVRTKENIDAIDRLITETPQKSVRRVLHELDGNVSKSSVHRILKFDLKLIPYKISVMQHLKETDIRSRLFAHKILCRPDSVPKMFFFCFYLKGEKHIHCLECYWVLRVDI